MPGVPLSTLVSKTSRSTFGRSPSTAFVMETGFPMGDDPEEHEDLLEEFTMAADAVVDITSAQDVVNKVFD